MNYGEKTIFSIADGILSLFNVVLNSPKRTPYCNSASGFDFDHITAVDMPFCTSLPNFIQKNDVIVIFKYLRHIEF